ncbi:MAG: TVP38/TMEM64 family protein [Planctomycetes bacterium]|nr:TVP38/TMEM64 family protein [Planctomycetota bacterium]
MTTLRTGSAPTDTVEAPAAATPSRPTPATSADASVDAEQNEARALGKALALVGLIALCIVVVALTPLKELLEPNLLKAHHWVERFGVVPTALAFAVVSALGIAIAIPRVLFAAAAGVLFENTALALLVAQAGVVLGCWINFAYARALGREFVRAKLGVRFRGLGRVLEFIDRHGVTGNILIRSLPVGNCFVLNLLMAVSPVRLGAFLIGTAFGTIPGSVVYVLLGNSAHSHASVKIGLSLALMILWCVPYWLWMRRRRRSRAASAP